jgi:hypothetical protein
LIVGTMQFGVTPADQGGGKRRSVIGLVVHNSATEKDPRGAKPSFA